jgi:hypothetical protein
MFIFCCNGAVTNLYMSLMGPVDLKKKYKAEWALVTGAGTGIGKSIAETMAAQGLNVVLVSLPDKFLEETTKALQEQYPKQKFLAVGAKFDHKTDYMPDIIKVCFFFLYNSLFNSYFSSRRLKILILRSFSIMLDIL